MTDKDKVDLIRSIVISAKIEAGNNLSPGASSAIAWRTIGEINKILSGNDENKPANLVIRDLQ
jgi:hypothetical protein